MKKDSSIQKMVVTFVGWFVSIGIVGIFVLIAYGKTIPNEVVLMVSTAATGFISSVQNMFKEHKNDSEDKP